MSDHTGGPADQPDEGQSERPRDDRCPTCGSRRVRYHVRRSGAWGHPVPERSLVWECRDCQTRWTERLVAFFNDHPTLETSGGHGAHASDTRPRIPKDPI